MSEQSASSRGGWSTSRAEDGWGPATSVRPGESSRPRPESRASRELRGADEPGRTEWSAPGAVSGRDQRAARRADERIEAQLARMGRSKASAAADSDARPYERGWPWWAALLVLIVIAAAGGVIDTVGVFNVSNAFNVAIVVAAVVAILIVRRSHMFPVVIAPPIVYSVATVFQLYLRSGGLSDRKVIFDAAANYLVYGFPAIAAATAAVLIIAGIRLITRK